MLSDEQILQKASLLLEKISENSDLTTEVLLREISDAEMKGVEAILQKLADNPKGALAFDHLFGDKIRLVIPFPTTDTSTELGQFVNLLQNELGYDVEWEKGLISAEKKFKDESIDADVARLQGREWKADRVKKIQMKIGKFFKKMADDGRKLNALHQKAMDWTFEYGDREVSQPQNLTGEEIEKALDDKERKYLYVLESNLNWYLGPDRDWKFGTKNIENFERLGEYWMKNAEYIKDNIKNLENDQYSIILTRHPVDVMRMSDFEKITSCHTPPSRAGTQQTYYKCAVAEAQGHGALAYVVETEELLSATNTGNIESAEQELEEYDEIFIEQNRYLHGTNLDLNPVARTRLRQFKYYRDFDGEDEEYGKELAVPEKSVYGIKIPGLVGTVTNWARTNQEELLNKMPMKDGKVNLSNFEIYGGSYEDTQGYGGRKELLSNLTNFPEDEFTGQVEQNQETEQEMPPEWVGDVEEMLKRECGRVREKWNSGKYANCEVDFYVRDESYEGDYVVYPEGKIMLTWELDEWTQLPNVSEGRHIADYLNERYYNQDLGAIVPIFAEDKAALYRGGPENNEVIIWRCEFDNRFVPGMENQSVVFDADGYEHYCKGVNELDDDRDRFQALVEEYAKVNGYFEGGAYMNLVQRIENGLNDDSYEWDIEWDGEYHTDSYEAWASISYDFDPEELGIETRILFDLVDRREFALMLREYLTRSVREELDTDYRLVIRNKSAVEVGGEVRYSITFKVDSDTPDKLVEQFYELVTGDMDDEDEIAAAFMGALREEAAKNNINVGQPPAEKQRNFDDLKDLGEVWRRFI
jgi:hypothetical protein